MVFIITAEYCRFLHNFGKSCQFFNHIWNKLASVNTFSLNKLKSFLLCSPKTRKFSTFSQMFCYFKDHLTLKLERIEGKIVHSAPETPWRDHQHGFRKNLRPPKLHFLHNVVKLLLKLTQASFLFWLKSIFYGKDCSLDSSKLYKK